MINTRCYRDTRRNNQKKREMKILREEEYIQYEYDPRIEEKKIEYLVCEETSENETRLTKF